MKFRAKQATGRRSMLTNTPIIFSLELVWIDWSLRKVVFKDHDFKPNLILQTLIQRVQARFALKGASRFSFS